MAKANKTNGNGSFAAQLDALIQEVQTNSANLDASMAKITITCTNALTKNRDFGRIQVTYAKLMGLVDKGQAKRFVKCLTILSSAWDNEAFNPMTALITEHKIDGVPVISCSDPAALGKRMHEQCPDICPENFWTYCAKKPVKGETALLDDNEIVKKLVALYKKAKTTQAKREIADAVRGLGGEIEG